ncbi:hypothetical protein FRC07_006880 [Ceratobasidium sp. 392]|nr:hypothetical protein FRC07_006880 [Ceratobasidium sp. 392]
MSKTSNDDDIPLFMRTLIFKLPPNLLEIPTSKLPAEVPQTLIDTLADQSKSEGDRLYREKKWQEARDAYMYGIGLQPSDPNIRKTTLLNLAAADLQLKDWNAVIRNTSWILKTDPNSVKGLYRAARALAGLECYTEALDCCDRALKLEPHNKPIQEERRAARKEIIKIQQQLLSEAYKYHHLLIVPNERDMLSGPTVQSSLMPYFDPPFPEDPTKATLFCNLSITYVERCSGDSISDFPFDRPIWPLLATLLPGPTPHDSTHHKLVIMPNPLLSTAQQSSNIVHPTSWDPKYEFLPSNLVLYAATRRREIIHITGDMTLADVCAETRRLSPDPPNQEDAYRQDGEYIEIIAGLITLHAFRKGSRAQERFKNQSFESLIDLAEPEYVVSQIESVWGDTRLRTLNYGPPNQAMNDPTSLSFAARRGMLRLVCGN